jgi:hypothetical protein
MICLLQAGWKQINQSGEVLVEAMQPAANKELIVELECGGNALG